MFASIAQQPALIGSLGVEAADKVIKGQAAGARRLPLAGSRRRLIRRDQRQSPRRLGAADDAPLLAEAKERSAPREHCPSRSPRAAASTSTFPASATVCPDPGETVTGQRYTIALGGKGANQAAAVARLGGQSIFVGRRERIRFAALPDAGSTRWASNATICVTDDASTGVALISVDARGENCIVVIGGANIAVSALDIDAASRHSSPPCCCSNSKRPWRRLLAAA